MSYFDKQHGNFPSLHCNESLSQCSFPSLVCNEEDQHEQLPLSPELPNHDVNGDGNDESVHSSTTNNDKEDENEDENEDDDSSNLCYRHDNLKVGMSVLACWKANYYKATVVIKPVVKGAKFLVEWENKDRTYLPPTDLFPASPPKIQPQKKVAPTTKKKVPKVTNSEGENSQGENSQGEGEISQGENSQGEGENSQGENSQGEGENSEGENSEDGHSNNFPSGIQRIRVPPSTEWYYQASVLDGGITKVLGTFKTVHEACEARESYGST